MHELIDFTEDELEAVDPRDRLVLEDPIQETRATAVNINENTNIYVPHSRLEEFRGGRYDNQDFNILSLESKSLQHELRMQERYEDEGTLEYKSPWDVQGYIIDFKWGQDSYETNPEIIDISE